MNSRSKYAPLKYIVECKPRGQEWFKPIAAFNLDRIAIEYAAKVQRLMQPSGFEYQVLERYKDSPEYRKIWPK